MHDQFIRRRNRPNGSEKTMIDEEVAKLLGVYALTKCCTCSIVYKVPKDWLDHKRSTGQSFYCPNGHSLHYPKKDDKPSPEVAELKKDLLTTKSRNEQLEAQVEELQKQLAEAKRPYWPWSKG